MRRSVFFAFLFVVGIGAFGVAQTKKAAPARPSLDRLVARVDAYWKLLATGNRARAATYITRSDRRKFSAGNTPQFRDPCLKSIELSPDRREAKTTVVVKRTVPPMPVEMDWPVTEQWRFERGNWYRRHNPQFLPFLAGADLKVPTPGEIEASKLEIRKKLQFDEASFDFGTVDQGENVLLTVKYTLTGHDPIQFIFRTSATGSSCPDCDRERGITLREPKDNTLSPGEGQELSVEVPTRDYDGAVNEKFILIAKVNAVEVPFEFSLRGFVYTPISISPKSLRFKRGEREKEIMVRNNSKDELELEKFISETRSLTVSPFPVAIQPGEQAKLVIKAGEEIDSVIPNVVDRVAITYKPVDGFSGLSYKVYLNYREENQIKTSNPAEKDEIQELIKRYAMPLPKR